MSRVFEVTQLLGMEGRPKLAIRRDIIAAGDAEDARLLSSRLRPRVNPETLVGIAADGRPYDALFLKVYPLVFGIRELLGDELKAAREQGVI